jgi:hypothetical protein
MSIASRPTSLDASTSNGASPGSRRSRARRGEEGATLSIDVEFGVSIGGLGTSRLASEVQRGLSRSRTSTVPIRIHLAIQVEATSDRPTRQSPVVAEVAIAVDGRPLGEGEASFAVVETLRGVLTFGTRRLHLDLADGVGPWIRCSLPCHSAMDPAALADEPTEATDPLAADATNLSGSGYCWLRPLSDWRLAGGTATPRLVSMSIAGREPAGLALQVDAAADHLASNEMRNGAAGC